jgi:rare lipoprotein A
MNQRFWSGLTAAAFMATTPGAIAAPLTELDSSSDAATNPSVSLDSTEKELPVPHTPTQVEEPALDEVSKVGEFQSDETPSTATSAIAIIQSHEMQGRSAATVYIRDIPVLTFLGSSTSSEQAALIDTAVAEGVPESEIKIGSTQSHEAAVSSASLPHPRGDRGGSASVHLAQTPEPSADPISRAASIAAEINQFHQNQLDANNIQVRWDTEQNAYLIEVNEQELVQINAQTILPDTTGQPSEDALQATNRLRRLMGGAPPLTEIEGEPEPVVQEISLGPIQLSIRGMASWYGPGFHGNRSASGEIFNQNAMTAAHRNLPFGTQVRVTNLNTGIAVVVRINDRGPFSRGRVIDLSAAAARAIGMIGSGVAPVTVEVLGVTSTATSVER